MHSCGTHSALGKCCAQLKGIVKCRFKKFCRRAGFLATPLPGGGSGVSRGGGYNPEKLSYLESLKKVSTFYFK